MSWLGQHIWGFTSRFRNDVYLEKLDTSSDTNILVVNSAGKITTNTSAGGGGGTVTSFATTGPITGGPITTTGTIGISAATQSSAGSMSAGDKVKVDNLTSIGSVLAVMTFNFNPSLTTQYCAPGNSGVNAGGWTSRRADYDDGTDKIAWWLQNGIIIPHACTLEGIKGTIRCNNGIAESETHTFKFLHIPAGSLKYDVTSGNNQNLHRFCQASTTVTLGGYVPISADGTSSDNSNLTQPLAAGDMLIPMIKENGGRINGSIFGSISIYIS